MYKLLIEHKKLIDFFFTFLLLLSFFLRLVLSIEEGAMTKKVVTMMEVSLEVLKAGEGSCGAASNLLLIQDHKRTIPLRYERPYTCSPITVASPVSSSARDKGNVTRVKEARVIITVALNLAVTTLLSTEMVLITLEIVSVTMPATVMSVRLLLSTTRRRYGEVLCFQRKYVRRACGLELPGTTIQSPPNFLVLR